MARETNMMFLELGEKMFSKYDEDRSNFDIAISSLKEILKHKILYNGKNHMLGIYLSGDIEENNIIPVQKINLNMIKYVNSMKKLIEEFENTNSFYSDLSKSIKLLIKKAGSSKGKKKIIIFTSADFEIDYDEDEIDKLIKFINSKNIFVNIISFNFWNVDNSKLTENQIKNKLIFKKMIKYDNFKIFSSSLTLLMQRQFRKKEKIIKPNFVGFLDICPQINLPIQIFSKTKLERNKTFKNYNKNLEFDSNEKTNLVKRENVYDEDEQIDKSDLIKGFNYGDQIIPINKDIEDLMKFKDNKGLKIISFVLKSQVPRHFYLSESEVIYPQGSKNHVLAFNSIVRSCLENEKLGIAKYVKKDESNPKLVVLHPYYKKRNFCFYLLELPTIEDIREYQFKSLKNSTLEQRNSIKNFINKMDLMKIKKGNHFVEELNPSKMFNPNIQYFNQCIIHKIENGNQEEIPEIDKDYITQYKINEILLKECDEEIEDLKNNLKLEKNLEFTEENKKRVYWKNLLEEYEINQNNLQNELIAEKLEKDDKNYVKVININHALSDFKDMMNNRIEDLVNSAITQMIEIIKKLINDSNNKENFDKAIEYIKYLRDSCVFEEEHKEFNNFLNIIKEEQSFNYKLFFKELILRRISLISNEEVNGSNITDKESQIFLNFNIENIEKNEDVVDNDEIFDEID